MDIGILKESDSRDKRVAVTPKVVSKIFKLGYNVLVEEGLGSDASFYDNEYADAGAIISDTNKVWSCDIVLKINKPNLDEVNKLSKNQKKYAATDVLYLHKIKEKLDNILERENRMNIARACFEFISHRTDLDLYGWQEVDIFKH